MPFSLYSTFVVEEKHGFNNQTLAFFLKDQCKQVLLSTVLTTLICSVLIFVTTNTGEFFFIYAWLFMASFVLCLQLIYPDYIAP